MRTVRVKAWAVLNIRGTLGVTLIPGHDQIKISKEWYKGIGLKVVPCTITYRLTGKGEK